MNLIDALPTAPHLEEGLFFNIESAVKCNGSTGVYARLSGTNPNDELDVITVDAKHFELLNAYLTQADDGTITGSIPVFVGNNGKWRFSTLATAPTPADNSEAESDYRLLRVSFPPEVARKVREKAARTKLSANDLVRSYVKAAL